MDSLGDFRVVSPIGQGVSTQTFHVEREGVSAVGKRLAPRFRADDEARRAFDTEGEVLALLDGRAAPRLVARGTDGKGPWLVLEALPSPSLAAYVAARGPLVGEAPRLENLVDLALSALAGVHEARALDAPLSIVHGDLSPENLLVSLEAPSPAVWIIDFGLASFRGSPVGTHGALRGTPRYVAPEVARGEPATPGSDLFSLGLTLLFAASGEPPRSGASLARVLVDAGEEPVTPYVERATERLPPGLARALTSLVAFDPHDRPPSARAAREAWRPASW